MKCPEVTKIEDKSDGSIKYALMLHPEDTIDGTITGGTGKSYYLRFTEDQFKNLYMKIHEKIIELPAFSGTESYKGYPMP